MEINLGDVVQLKSGGPKMTVSQYLMKDIDGCEHPDKIECRWFDSRGNIKHYIFNIDEITKL